MLTHLQFKNFKTWRDSGPIRLAPLTVLFGTNSAGKTSIAQLLLLLKQTADSADRQRALHLGDARTPVDLGTYDEVVFNRDVENPLEFGLTWKLADELRINDPLSTKRTTGDRLSFAATLRADKKHQPYVDQLEYVLKADEEPRLQISLRRRKDGKYDLDAEHYRLVRTPGRAWPLPGPVRCYGFPDEAVAYFQNTTFLADLVLEFESMLRSLYYLGPLREHPRRLYLWSGEVPEHVGVKGDRAVEAILAARERDRKFNWKPKQKTKPLDVLVAKHLRDMGLISEFKIASLGEHRKEYEVLVRTGRQLPWVKLPDVGFGVSQVLPVIVECFYVPPGSIVIFEQPEIHLHPKVQADLADVFIAAVRAREDGSPRRCQFIIESHSEHFLRRLQRRIAEEELSEHDAALYFVSTSGGAAHIEELDVDRYGNIRNWPDNFFGDEMADLVARSEAQARRMQSGSGR